MIVKVCPARPAGTGRRLGTYILAAKHEHEGERLGAYIDDPEKAEKLLDSWTSNTGVADPKAAIGWIEKYNAQNTRWHKVSRLEHFIVSFPENEYPTREQCQVIEGRLMAAIGFDDHPRIVARHCNSRDSPTGGFEHMHLLVSRIDPTTLYAEHPHRSRLLLQAEAARLEIDLGLRIERKTLQLRERREIDERIALDLSHNRRHPNGEEMLTPSEPEQKTTLEFTRDEISQLIHTHNNAVMLDGPSITPGVSDSLSRKFAEASHLPHAAAIELTRSELFAIMVDNEINNHNVKPELSLSIKEKLARGEEHILSQDRQRERQVISKEIERQDREREAKMSDKEWNAHENAKAIKAWENNRKQAQHQRDTPEQALDDQRTILRLFNGDRSLSRQEVRAAVDRENERDARHYREKQQRDDREERGRKHERATPGDALYARFKTEKTIALGALKEAEQAVYDKFSGYQQGLRSFYNLRREQEKLNARQPSRIDRQNAHELLHAEARGDRAQAAKLRAIQLAIVRRDHQIPKWETFLEKESQRGDQEATRLLRQHRERQLQQGYER